MTEGNSEAMSDDKALDEKPADALPQENGGSNAKDDAAASELPAAAPAPVPVRYVYLDRIYRTRGINAIPPGTYKLDDAGLQGRGPYLLQNRIAVLVDGPDYAPASPDDDDDDTIPAEDGSDVVAIEYVGANKAAHKVKARGVQYEVPQQRKGPDGKPAPRVILVRADLASEFLSRGTFQKAR